MKLSIITISYNNKEGLKRTADSILPQTFRDFEWLIVDGGSSDGSKEVIEALAADPASNISYWCSEKDGGIYNALNKGIMHCSGDYISCMNSGDSFYESTTLEKVFSQDHHADIIYGDWKRIFADHEDVKSFPYPVEIFSFYEGNISHQAMFISRRYHVDHLYDESYKILADYRNWIDAVLGGATFDHVPEIICKVTMDGISSTRSDIAKAERERIRQEAWPENIRRSMQRLADYERNTSRIKRLLDKGGCPSLMTRAFLKTMSKIFLK